MRKLTVVFRNTHFDVEVYEDGMVAFTLHNGRQVDKLLFDMGFSDDIQTLALEAIAEQDNEIAQQRKCFNY
jgi:hypothetical protein